MTLKPLCCALALAAAPLAHAATATLGIDFGNLKIELIDLDPGDGIAPRHDFADSVYDGRAGGPGPVGAAGFDSLQPYGERFDAAPGGMFAADSIVYVVQSMLTPMTGAVFSAPAFASVSAGSGEQAAVSVSLFAGADFGSTFSDALGAGGVDGPDAASRTLSVRFDNRSAQMQSLVYGSSSSVFVSGVGVTPVPEPETWALLLLGVPLVVAARRRRAPPRR